MQTEKLDLPIIQSFHCTVKINYELQSVQDAYEVQGGELQSIYANILLIVSQCLMSQHSVYTYFSSFECRR